MTAATKLTAKRRSAFLAKLRETGNVSQAAEHAGTTRAAVYKLRERDEAFEAEWTDALDEAADKLEQEARRRAVEGWDEPVYQKGRKVGVVRRFSDGLLQTLLRATRPEKFRENVAVTGELKVNVGLADRLKDARERHLARVAAAAGAAVDGDAA